MLFWTRAGAAIGLFFHSLMSAHRSKMYFYENEKGRCWLYSCHDCHEVLTTICATKNGNKLNFGLKVDDEQIIEKEKAETETKTETKPKQELPNGIDQRRDETVH